MTLAARRRAIRFGFGLAVGMASIVLPAEMFLRVAPPADLQPYLGVSSVLAGPYVPDPAIGAAYRSLADLRALYADRLAGLERERAGRPVWTLFGNSFVQAPGMLGDTAQAGLPGRQMVFLRRNEPFYLRVAQFRLLLDEGLRPERAVFVVLPIDLLGIALQPIASVAVTPAGGLGRNARSPAWLAPALAASRLVLTGWVRSGRQALLPDFRARDVMRPLPELIADDLARLFGEIGRVATRHGVPVTVVFIPNREQLFGDPTTVPQDAFAKAARGAGLDFIDTSQAFRSEGDKAGLLIPDGHLSARGNHVLLDAILAHFGEPAP